MRSSLKLLAFPWMAVGLACFGLLLAGCGGGGGKTKMSTAELRSEFASADASLKTPVEAAAKLLDSGKLLDGANALTSFAKASHEKLSETQKNAIINVASTLGLIISEDPDKGGIPLYQAVEDLIAALEGREATKVGTNPDTVRPPATSGE